METHAHHLHNAPGKSFWHYFYEFLMLFLAVFCGFLAENFREHEVENTRERQYMQSLIYDLGNDTLNLRVGFPLKEKRLLAIDSVYSFFETHNSTEIIPGAVFRQMYRTIWDRHYRRNSTTIDQLRNAGGMRLIRKKNVADSIASYDLQWQRAEYWREVYITRQEKAMNLLHQIFNASDLVSLYKNQNTGSPVIPSTSDSLKIRVYQTPLNEYLNFLNDQKITTRQDSRAYQSLEKTAENLIALIKKEYHFE